MKYNRLNQAVTALLLTILASSATAADYSISWITSSTSSARDINDVGEIVGQYKSKAYIYDPVNNYQYITSPYYMFSDAHAVNASGQVAGRVILNPNEEHAFIYDSNNGFKDIGTLGGDFGRAYGINDVGQVVGVSSTKQDTYGTSHAFIYDSTNGMQDLGTLGGRESEAMSINNSGHVVGMSSLSNWERHAFIYDDNGMRDIGTLGGRDSYASGINNVGQVVGGSDNSDGDRRAFIYDETNGMQGLGTLEQYDFQSEAIDINDHGHVIGLSYDSNYQWRPFIYDNTNGMRDLNSLVSMLDLNGWVLSVAFGINNSGDIVGEAFKAGVGSQAFLLTNITGVPIPPAGLLFAPALLGLVMLRAKAYMAPIKQLHQQSNHVASKLIKNHIQIA